MLLSSPTLRSRRSRRPRRARLHLEELEARHLLSVSWPGFSNPIAASGSNSTFGQAQVLPTLATNGRVEVVGSIAGGQAEVDYYQFTLSQDATVQLQTMDQGNSPLVSVLTLFTPNGDTFTPLGNNPPFVSPEQVIAQDDGGNHGGDAAITMTLSAGTYVAAVSGHGNRYFNPDVPNSGYAGSSGAYGLLLTTSAPGAPAPPFVWIPSHQYTGMDSDNPVQRAYNLPDLSQNLGQMVSTTGFIGDDPYYAALGFDPGNDVDYYHFQVTGAGLYAFGAEILAGRINSALNPVVSLYQENADGSFTLLDSAGITGNTAFPQLATDSVLYAGLTQGDYYLAVGSGFNIPDPNSFVPTLGYFGGPTTGPYVLNVKLDKATVPSQLVASSLVEGKVLPSPPTQLVLQFDGPMNLQQLAFDTYFTTLSTQVPLYITTSTGPPIQPWFVSYDPTTNRATFQIVDAIPNGPAELHLSGGQTGFAPLTDLAGQPIPGNDPSGDYVIHFTVAGPQRGTPTDPTTWIGGVSANRDFPQDLGMLFPVELATGVTVQRDRTPGPNRWGEYYRFDLEPNPVTSYTFSLTSPDGMPTDGVVRLWSGTTEDYLIHSPGSNIYMANLDQGRYEIGVEWPNKDPQPYHLVISLAGFLAEPATSLTLGPSPALLLRLASVPPPPPLPVPLPSLPFVGPNLSPGGATSSSGSSAPTGQTGGSTTGGSPILPPSLIGPANSSNNGNNSLLLAAVLPQGSFLSLSARPLGSVPASATPPRIFLTEPPAGPSTGLTSLLGNASLLLGGEDGRPQDGTAARNLQETLRALGQVESLAVQAVQDIGSGFSQTSTELIQTISGGTEALDALFAGWASQPIRAAIFETENRPSKGEPPLAAVAVVVPHQTGAEPRAVLAEVGRGWFRPLLAAPVGVVCLTVALALVRAARWRVRSQDKRLVSEGP